MTEDSLNYLKVQADRHYQLVNAISTPRCFWGDQEKWHYHEYLFWQCRYLEKQQEQIASALGFSLECLARVKKDLGEDD